MEERPINLYGSEENGRRTTFTGTLRVASRDSWITYIQGIDFVGDGGVGISASARLWVEDCTFTGWKTGVLGYGDAWVNVIGCTLADNEIGFTSTARRARPATACTTTTALWTTAPPCCWSGCPPT